MSRVSNYPVGRGSPDPAFSRLFWGFLLIPLGLSVPAEFFPAADCPKIPFGNLSSWVNPPFLCCWEVAPFQAGNRGIAFMSGAPPPWMFRKSLCFFSFFFDAQFLTAVPQF